MSEHTTPELWVPGQPLEIPFESPTQEVFRLRFVNKVWNGEGEPSTINLEDCLSALKVTETTPTALAFVDLDDLIGNLGYSLRLLQHQPNGRQTFTHDYGHEMFFGDKDPIKQPLMRLVKNHEQPGIGIQPVEDAEAIASMLRSWRSAGVYVTCITSAVLGAELPAVDFLAQYYNRAFDGIVATNSNYALADKGKAAAQVADFVGVQSNTPAIHLDDIHHNTQKVRAGLEAHPANLQVATFQHVFDHPSHLGVDPGSQHGKHPLEVFMLGNDYLAEKLGRTLHIPLASFVKL